MLDGTVNNTTAFVTRSFNQVVSSGEFWFSYLTDRNNASTRTTLMTFFGPSNGQAGTPGNSIERFGVGEISIGDANTVETGGAIALLMNNSNPAGVVQSAVPVNMNTNLTHLIIGRVQFDNGAVNAFGGVNDTVTV